MKYFIKQLSILFLLAIAACKTNSIRIVVCDAPTEVKVTANSGCKNSTILPLENEAGLKTNIQSYAVSSLKKMKFKTNKKVGQSTCRISGIELVINENC